MTKTSDRAACWPRRFEHAAEACASALYMAVEKCSAWRRNGRCGFRWEMGGIHLHCGQHPIKRYLAEFDFRYNERAALGVDDTARTVKALAGIVGKRLLYRDSSIR